MLRAGLPVGDHGVERNAIYDPASANQRAVANSHAGADEPRRVRPPCPLRNQARSDRGLRGQRRVERASVSRTVPGRQPARPISFRLVRTTLSAALGLALAALVFEAGLRHVYWLPYLDDPVLGTVVMPGITAVYRIEGSGTSRWTEGGIRRAAPPDPWLASILVLVSRL